MNDKNKKNGIDREEHGYGYEKSVEDLKVIGQNNQAKNNKENVREEKRK